MDNNNDPNNDNDGDFEDIGRPLFLPADHPLTQNMQQAFNKQLSAEYERVHLEYLEKSANLKNLEKDKEDVGVQLYGLQQQLADMQLSFEAAHENYNNIQRIREENESRMGRLSENLEFREREISELTKKVDRASDELSRLNLSIKQVQDYNDQMRSEIKNMQRTTHRTEENIVDLEKDKKSQDILIDQLNEQIKRLSEQKAILEAQLKAQVKETSTAKEILTEAQIEMEKIMSSKKNLLNHWQNALFEIQKQDKNLQMLKETLKIQEELNIKITSEMNGVEKEITQVNEKMTFLTDMSTRLEHARENWKTQNQDLGHRRKKVDQTIVILKESQQATESQIRELDRDKSNLQHKIDIIENSIMKLHTETKNKEEEIINKLSQHKTIDKTNHNLLKQTFKLGNQLEEKNVEFENLKNEMARVELDILNTEEQLIELEKRRKEVETDRKNHEKDVTEFEGQVKENHDIHEKKMHDVAKYNRDYEKALQKQNFISKGPTEANINHIRKETEELNQDHNKLKGKFINDQKQYVILEQDCFKVETEIVELRRKGNILEQKKIRLHSKYEGHVKEIKRIQNALKNFENDMNKLNDFLADNFDKAMNLQNDNINIDSEFIQKLKELEKDSVKLEVDIDRLKESKAELLSDIVESERQILLWERKIQLEKEMQEKLDPNFGQSEIKNLKKQIHLLELQIDDVRKNQDQQIISIERAVYKRESIQLKYTNRGKKDLKKRKSKLRVTLGSPTKIAKQIQILKSTINQASKGLKETDKNLRAKENELENVRRTINARSTIRQSSPMRS